MDQYRRDIVEKDRLIDKKNKEIVKLRMHVEDIQNQMESQPISMSQKERFAIMKEFDYMVEIIFQELERAKVSMFKDENKTPRGFASPNNNIHQFNSEDNLLKQLKERVDSLKNLVSLAQEVQLLS